MTVIAPTGRVSSPIRHAPTPSYAHAHWYMAAALAVVVAGFWPSFYQPLSGGTTLRTVHGVTSTLWYLALIAQPWLVTHGYVRWHRRVAIGVIALLPIVCVTALMNTRVMLLNSGIPPFARPLIAYLDFTLTALFIALFVLGLLNRKTPAAHKRYMAATVLVGFPPALTRFFVRTFTVDPLMGIAWSFYVCEAVLIAAIIWDWRAGERRRWAYPIALATHVVVQVFMMPISMAPWWVAFCRWFSA